MSVGSCRPLPLFRRRFLLKHMKHLHRLGIYGQPMSLKAKKSKTLKNPLALNVQGHWMPARHALSLQPVVCGSQNVRRMSCRGVTHVGDLTSQMFRHATLANWKGNMSWTEWPEIVGVDLAETDGK